MRKNLLSVIFVMVLVIGSFLVAQKYYANSKVSASDHHVLFFTNVTALKTFSPLYSTKPIPTPTPDYNKRPAGYCLFVPVLMYHHIQPEAVAVVRGQTSLTVDPTIFDEQMNYVATHGYSAITAESLVMALRNHTGLLWKSIVITLDDGYDDNFQYAFPIFQKYHLLANFMVSTGLLGGVGNNTYYTWDKLSQMVGSGLVDASDHTWSHFAMGTKTPDKDQSEIMTAKEQLESHLGKHQTIFTYPYGTRYNNLRVTQELIQDGFLGAFSTIPGSWQCDSYVYALRRTRIGNVPLIRYGI